MDSFFLRSIEVPPIVIGCLLGKTFYRRHLFTWKNGLLVLPAAYFAFFYMGHYMERDTSRSLWLNIDEPRAFFDFVRYYARFLFFGVCFFPSYYLVQTVAWAVSLSDPRTGWRVFRDSLCLSAFVAAMMLPCFLVLYAFGFLLLTGANFLNAILSLFL